MNREDLKKTLKPLIKECIKEVLFEEAGVLSRVVNEVATGLTAGGQQKIVETRTAKTESDDSERQRRAEEARRRLDEHKRSVMQQIGESAYNGVDLFEGTTPMTSAPSASGGSASPMGPMKDLDPNDPGIDLNSIPGLNMDVAKKLMGK